MRRVGTCRDWRIRLEWTEHALRAARSLVLQGDVAECVDAMRARRLTQNQLAGFELHPNERFRDAATALSNVLAEHGEVVNARPVDITLWEHQGRHAFTLAGRGNIVVEQNIAERVTTLGDKHGIQKCVIRGGHTFRGHWRNIQGERQ